MNKKLAQKHIGKRVSIWTSLRGEYEGVLVEVIPVSPWRGIVKIDKVTTPAFCVGWRNTGRKTKVIGELIEAGASSIKPI